MERNFYVEGKIHSDPLEAANDALRTAEREVGTSHMAETGKYEFFDSSSGSTVSDSGLENRKSTGFSITIPDSSGNLFDVSGTINKRKKGFKAGAEVSKVEVD
jgi:hypothetical protein